jgi:hypothetical protein
MGENPIDIFPVMKNTTSASINAFIVRSSTLIHNVNDEPFRDGPLLKEDNSSSSSAYEIASE